nr:MAG TPA: hypothetical protein [Caudoviricetes sp.]
MLQDEIDSCLMVLDAPSAKKTGKKYKGYDVLEPDMSKVGKYIGYPYVILVKGEHARLSTVEESLECLDL